MKDWVWEPARTVLPEPVTPPRVWASEVTLPVTSYVREMVSDPEPERVMVSPVGRLAPS